MRGRGLALALVVFSAVMRAQVPDLRRGLQLFQEGQYEAALNEFQRASRAQPDNSNLHNVIGIVLTKLGRLAEANQHYRRAIELNPKLANPRKNLGFNYLTMKQYGPAEKEIQAALRLAPDDQFLHHYAGMLYLATGRDAEALRHLDQSKALLTNDSETSFEAAKACFRLNRPQEAVERFRDVAQRDPKAWPNRYNLAIALLHVKNYKESITILEPLAAELPENADVLSLLGVAYEAHEKYPLALEAYQKALKADPKNPDRYLDYTRLLMDLDRYDESSRLVEEGLKQVEDAYALYMRLGSVQMTLGKQGQARESFQKAIAAHPEIALGYVGLARAYLRDGQESEAANALRSARGKTPPDFLVEFYSGLVLSRLAQYDEAAKALAKAIQMNPNLPEPHYELGKVLFSEEKFEPAKVELERAIQLAPRHVGAHYQLSRVCQSLGDTKRAHELADRTKDLRQAEIQERTNAQRSRLASFGAVGPK